jgi:ABC-type antimicrobial peptide transport system permease subunit
MGIGVGVLLAVIGLVLMFAIDVNIPGIDDNTLGIILVVAGIAGIVLGMIASRNAGRTRTVEERHIS